MHGFVKLHGSIIASTVWAYSDRVRLVWITMLAISDQDGRVSASVPGLASLAHVPIEAVEEALALFLSPDAYSRTKDHDGRRVEVIDGGWLLLNHGKYRDLLGLADRRARDAARQARKRERDKSHPVTPSHVTHVTSRDCHTSETDPKTDPKTEEIPDGEHAAPPAPLVAPAGAQPVRPAKAARGSRLPEGWAPSDATLAALRAEGHATPAGALASFRDYWAGVPGQKGVKLDWEGTYRNWVRRDATRGNGPGPRAPRRDGRILQELQPEQANADWMVRTPEGDERLRARREEIRASREESARKRQAEMDEMKARYGTR